MTSEEQLKSELLAVEVNEGFTEAVMQFHDNSDFAFVIASVSDGKNRWGRSSERMKRDWRGNFYPR